MSVHPLLDSTLLVPIPTGRTPLDDARRAMARWSNGDAHVAARGIAVELLRRLPVAELRSRARSAAEAELRTASDLVPVARFVPVMVLAEALGFASPRRTRRPPNWSPVCFVTNRPSGRPSGSPLTAAR